MDLQDDNSQDFLTSGPPAEPGNEPTHGPAPVYRGSNVINFPDKGGSNQNPQPAFPDKLPAVQVAHNQVKDTNPDDNAQVLKLSRQTGDSPAFIANNLPAAKKAADSPTNDYFKDLVDKASRTADFMSSTDNAAVAHDSLPNMAAHEHLLDAHDARQQAMDSIFSTEHQPTFDERLLGGGGTFNDIFLQAQASSVGFFETAARLPTQLAEFASREVGYPMDYSDFGIKEPVKVGPIDAFTKTRSQIAWEHLHPDTVQPLSNPVADYLKERREAVTPPESSESITGLIGQGKYAEAGQVAAVQTIGGALPGILKFAELPVGVASTASEAYQEQREKGVTVEKAGPDAALKGAGFLLLSRLLAQPAISNQVDRIADAYGSGAARQFVSNFASKVLHTSKVMIGFNLGQQTADDFADKVTGANPDAFKGFFGKAMDNIVSGGLNGLLFGGIGTVAEAGAAKLSKTPKTPEKAPTEGENAPKTKVEAPTPIGPPGLPQVRAGAVDLVQHEATAAHNKDTYLSLETLATESKVNQRDPETYKAHLQAVAKDKAGESLYLPSEDVKRYFQDQNQDPEKAFEAIGHGDAYRQAEATGGDVQVPLGDWLSSMAGKPDFKALADHVKFEPEQKTVAEVDREKEIRANVDKEMEKHEADLAKDMSTRLEETQKAAEEQQQAAKATGLKGFISQMVSKLKGAKPSGAVKDVKAQGQYIAQSFRALAERIAPSADQVPAVFQELTENYKFNFFNEKNLSENGLPQSGLMSPLDYMKKSGFKLLVEKPDLTKLTGGAKEEAIENWRSRLQAAKEAGIPTAQSRDVMGANSPADLAGKFYDAGKAGFIPRGAIFEEAEKGADLETTGAKPDATHDQILEEIRNGEKGQARLYQSGTTFDSGFENEKRAQKFGTASQKDMLKFLHEHMDNPEKAEEFNKFVKTTREAVRGEAGKKLLADLAERYNHFHFVEEIVDSNGEKSYYHSGNPDLEALPYESAKREPLLLQEPSSLLHEPEVRQVGGERKEESAGQPRIVGPDAFTTSAGTSTESPNTLRDVDRYFQSSLKQGPRGFMEMAGEPGKRSFNVFVNEKSDASTFFHEVGHAFLFILKDLAASEDAPKDLKDDFQKTLDWFGVKNWEGVQEKHHEMFARGFEYRLWEGHVPVSGLRRVFDRFTDWLRKVYPSSAYMEHYFGAKMTPEMRGVYDRLMATKEEIETAKREMGYTPELPPTIPDGLKRQLVRSDMAADHSATGEVIKPMMKELTAVSKEEMRKHEELAREVAAREVSELPLFKAMDELEKGETDARRTAERIMSGEGGIPEKDYIAMEKAAEQNGYSSYDDLAKAISEAGFKETAIQERVDAYMSQFGELKDSQQAKDLAVKAVHNDKSLEALALKNEAFSRPPGKTPGEILANRDRALAEARAAKDKAKSILEEKTWKDAGNYRIYVTAERNAAVKARLAQQRGDDKMAEVYRRQQFLNHALASEAMANRSEITKSLKKLQPYIKRGDDMMGMSRGFIRQVDGVLESTQLKPKNPLVSDGIYQAMAQQMEGQGKTPEEIADQTGLVKEPNGEYRNENLVEFVKRVGQDNNHLGDHIPDKLLGGGYYGRNLTLGDLRDLKEAVMAIAHAGKMQDKAYSEHFDAPIPEVAHKIAEQLRTTFSSSMPAEDAASRNINLPFYERNRLPGEEHIEPFLRTPSHLLNDVQKEAKRKLGDLAKTAGAYYRSPVFLETLALLVDGKEDGAFHRYILWPLRDAQATELETHRERFEGLQKLQKENFEFAEQWKDRHFSNRTVILGGVKRDLSLAEIMNMARLWGSVTGRQRVTDGFKTNPEEVQKVLDLLEKKHWDFIQKRADFDQKLVPAIAKNEMDHSGVEFKPVELAPIETKFGTYPGWYHHIEYDRTRSNEAYQMAKVNEAQAATSNPYTAQGHLKARVTRVFRPPDLKDWVYYKYLEDAVHDLSYRGVTQDLNRLFRNKEFAKTLSDSIGPEFARMPGDVLRYIAGGPPAARNALESGVNLARKAGLRGIIGIRPILGLIKFTTDNWQMVNQVGIKPWASAMWNYNFNPGERAKVNAFVDSTDAEMKHAADNFNFDAATFVRQWDSPLHHLDLANFWVERVADRNVRKPFYNLIYQDAIKDHTPEEAKNIAAQVVNRRLGIGTPMYHNLYQRGGAMGQAMAAGRGYAFAMFNNFWKAGKVAGLEYNKGNVGAAAIIVGQALAVNMVVPALIYWGYKEMARNPIQQTPDKDRKKRLLEKLSMAPVEGLPGVPETLYFMESMYERKHGEPWKQPDLSLSPVAGALTQLAKGVYDTGSGIFGEKLTENDAEDIAKGVDRILQMPDYMEQTAFNFWDDWNHRGELTWRDLVTRKTKK